MPGTRYIQVVGGIQVASISASSIMPLPSDPELHRGARWRRQRTREPALSARTKTQTHHAIALLFSSLSSSSKAFPTRHPPPHIWGALAALHAPVGWDPGYTRKDSQELVMACSFSKKLHNFIISFLCLLSHFDNFRLTGRPDFILSVWIKMFSCTEKPSNLSFHPDFFPFVMWKFLYP